MNVVLKVLRNINLESSVFLEIWYASDDKHLVLERLQTN